MIWTSSELGLLQKVLQPIFLAAQINVPHRVEAVGEHLPVVTEENSIVLAMGSRAVDILKLHGAVTKNLTLNSTRGSIFIHEGVRYLTTFDPGAGNKDASIPSQIAWDINLAVRFLTRGTLAPEVGDYRYVQDYTALISRIEEKYNETGKAVAVELDLETMGLFPWYPEKHIVTSSFTVDPGRSDVLYHLGVEPGYAYGLTEEVAKQIYWILTTDKVKLWGANLKYDLLWMRVKWGFKCTNYTFDSLLAGSLLNENRSNSLSNHTKEYLPKLGGYDTEFDAAYDKAHMEWVPKEPLLIYAGGDTDAGYQCCERIKSELLMDDRLARFYVKILHPMARAYEEIEYRGLVVDVDEYKELRATLEEEIKRLTAEAISQIPYVIRCKYAEDLRLTKPKLLRDLFFSKEGFGFKPRKWTDKADKAYRKTKNKAWRHYSYASTSIKDHLFMFEGESEEAKTFITTMKELSAATKTLSTFVDGYLTHLRPDGRLHPTYALYAGSMYEGKNDEAGTDTGRLSAKNPAIQTLVKHGKWATPLRECYPAPLGYLFWQLDFSQGELRIAACLSNDRNMLYAYANDQDLHCKTSARINSIEYDTLVSWKTSSLEEERARYKEVRQGGKAGNFGLLYGMSADGYKTYAEASYGVQLTIQEANRFREEFFKLYDGLIPWHNRQKAGAKKYGQVRSPLGRVAHLPLINSSYSEIRSKAERKSINSPVQCTLSDMNGLGIVNFKKKYGDPDECQIIGSTHDSTYGYVLESQVEYWLPVLKEVFETLNLPEEFGWEHQIPFPVDLELGQTMADLKEVALNK